MLQGEHSAILLTFIKLPFVIKIFVLSIFEWLFYTGFTHALHRFYCTLSWKFLSVSSSGSKKDFENMLDNFWLAKPGYK